MNSRDARQIGCKLLTGAAILCSFAAMGQPKLIRLRNEIIEPESGTNRAVMSAAQHSQAPANGLFLVQFSGAPEPVRREELRKMGVVLIKYVPDDTFIAKFNNVPLSSVGTLKDVTWIGPYRTENKIHPRLAAAAKFAATTNETVSINILLSPSSTPAELTDMRKHLLRVYSESHLRQGIIVRGELLP